MSKCDCPPAMGGRFLLSGAGLPKNMYKSRKSVLLELLNIEICAILYNVYPKRKGNLTLLHYDAILFDDHFHRFRLLFLLALLLLIKEFLIISNSTNGGRSIR